MRKGVKVLWILSFIFLFSNSLLFASDWNLPWVDIISRAERWADESIRYTSYPTRAALEAKRQAQAEEEARLKAEDPEAYEKKKAEEALAYSKTAKAIANAYLKNNYYDDMSIDATVSTYNGKSIEWKQSYKYWKTKIIIHHTAWSNTWIVTMKDAISTIKSIYKYHTLTNGWWDIWYNFIIDPFGNIYEGRAGGEWVIWAHAKWNNTPSIWISMIWNFDEVEPTKEALDSLVKLVAALAKKYDIDPFWKTNYYRDSKSSPYIETKIAYTIAWHKDASATACPWKNIYSLLPYIRASVYAINQWQERETAEMLWYKSQSDYLSWYTDLNLTKNTTNDTTDNSNKSNKSNKKLKLTYNSLESIKQKTSFATNEIKNNYVKSNDVSYASIPMQKIAWKIDIQKAKNYLKQDISVLLYELTKKYDQYQIECIDWCIIKYDSYSETQEYSGVNVLYSDILNIDVWEELNLQVNWENITPNAVSIESNDDVLIISNYGRKSYAWVPRNRFHWKIIITRDYMQDEEWRLSHEYVVINKLPFSQYMKWIVETNDTESQTKNEVMALISKSYALFYMDPQNQHPNIPSQAAYNAVDNPNIFQKYVWAWLEKTLTKWYKALENTKNKIIMYDDFVPILPYFSCSAWFTYSASERWWWTDTPYLQNKFDIWICSDKKFSWHWVWLSWLWAERRSTEFWRSYTDILKYYYPWITVQEINN